MSGHHLFSKLTKDFTPERRRRIKSMKAKLLADRPLHKARRLRALPQQEIAGDGEGKPSTDTKNELTAYERMNLMMTRSNSLMMLLSRLAVVTTLVLLTGSCSREQTPTWQDVVSWKESKDPRYSEGLRYYAEQGYDVAQFELGCLYHGKTTGAVEDSPVPIGERCEGRVEGVQIALGEAVMWMRQAAKQGHKGAQYELGKMYDGKVDYYDVVQKSPKDSAEWYCEAAKRDRYLGLLGHPLAQNNLGVLYKSQLGKKDFEDMPDCDGTKDGRQWLIKAARRKLHPDQPACSGWLQRG